MFSLTRVAGFRGNINRTPFIKKLLNVRCFTVLPKAYNGLFKFTSPAFTQELELRTGEAGTKRFEDISLSLSLKKKKKTC